MKKLITAVLTAGILATGASAKMPSYKTSTGIELGQMSMDKENDYVAGLFFKMEDKLYKNIYAGIGADYTSGEIKDIDVEFINIYPTMSINFTKKLSMNILGGISHTKAENNSIDKKELIGVYGAGIDYAFSRAMTHGIVFKKYESSTYLESPSSISYRIGFKF